MGEQLMADDPRWKRVLVVEPSADVREALATLLRDEGHAVAEAGTGAEALAQLRAHPETDVVLLALELPEMDGWAFRTEQSRDPRIGGIPVAALGEPRPEDPRAGSVFFNRYFPRPLHLRLLLDYVADARRLDLSGLP